MSFKYMISTCFLLLNIVNICGQQFTASAEKNAISDTVNIAEIEVTAYKQTFKHQTPVSVALLSRQDLDIYPPTSFVTALNTVPGVQMEERSPGSYRLSIRGSLIRSPYGVRNVKIYYNDFSLTDAGGNTYLNALNVSDISSVEIQKGPDGSLYGANSGGVVFLKSAYKPQTKAEVFSGSYGLFGEAIKFSHQFRKHFFSVSESFQRSDGYRQNTRNHRLFIQLSDRWNYNPKGELFLNGFFSDLNYLTPGGLTKAQYDENPRQARQATATMPGSVEQKTGIDQKIYFAGVRHNYQFTPKLSHVISLWWHHVDFTYPFITNYEIRHENNLGIRTYLAYENNSQNKSWLFGTDIGFEGQQLTTDIYNYDNNAGEKGDLQAYDDILNKQAFVFLNGKIRYKEKLTIQASASLNFNGYHFRDTVRFKHNFKTILMPHFAVNYRVCNPLDVRFCLSRGYSPPTTAEVRPSDNKIYKDLQPEHGWNTEAGIRLNTWHGRIAADASLFHYLLKDGIVSQVDSTANTHFVNAGKIKQVGFELKSSCVLITGNIFFRTVRWNSSFTWSDFNYTHYIKQGNNYSGNRVAGVPRQVIINSLEIQLPLKFDLFIQHNHTAKIPLDDANNNFANSYNLLYIKAGWTKNIANNYRLNIYCSVDNLLNQKYSLGNDINAAGGRYFNAAPGINFTSGVCFSF